MKYFLHDSNAFNDEKVTQLFIEFGYEGLGLFYTILEKLALQEKPVLTSVLKHQLKVGKKLNKCWNFMESIELISSNNGETFNKQLLNFSEKYQIKKQKNTERIAQWRKNQEDSENVMCYESVRNSPKVKESKVNRSKAKETTDIFSENEIIIKDYIEKNCNGFSEELKQWILLLETKYNNQTSIIQLESFLRLLNGWYKTNDQKKECLNKHISSTWKTLNFVDIKESKTYDTKDFEL